MGVDEQPLTFVSANAGSESGGGDEVAAGYFCESVQSVSESEWSCVPRALQGDPIGC